MLLVWPGASEASQKKTTKEEKDVQTKMEMAMLHAGRTSICTENGWQIMM
jgi:hypothetical protein